MPSLTIFEKAVIKMKSPLFLSFYLLTKCLLAKQVESGVRGIRLYFFIVSIFFSVS